MVNQDTKQLHREVMRAPATAAAQLENLDIVLCTRTAMRTDTIGMYVKCKRTPRLCAVKHQPRGSCRAWEGLK